jgi:hypothetical protein
MYLEVDKDGNADFVVYPLSANQFMGRVGPDDAWLLTGADASGNPLGVLGAVRTDYWASYTEWNLVAAALGIDPVNNPDFDFWFEAHLLGIGMFDETPRAHYDLSRPDVTYSYATGKLGPASPTDTLALEIQSPNAIGAMIVDFNGLPGQEVHFIPLEYHELYLPLVLRQ